MDNKQKIHLCFNKLTGAFIGQLIGIESKKLSKQYFVYKTLEFDPKTHIWQGSFEDGKLVALGQIKPMVTELELDAACHQKIKKRYKYYHQLNMLFHLVDTLLSKGVLDETDSGVSDFIEFKLYTERTRANNELFKASMIACPNHDYKTKEDIEAEMNDRLHGGLQTIVGRPPYSTPEY